MSTISVDYDVLNQRGSPAWFTDTFANIPTAGYVGRMFISKDTFAFYRDTGTGWDLIGGPGIGTLTGSGVVGQVSFFNGTQVLAGNNNLFWDNTNSRLGINTTTPGQPLDIHSTGNTLVQLNNTTTANSNISFQNQNVAKWRVGNLYNAGANSFDIQNATTSTTALSISNTTNQITLISQLNGTSADFSSSVSALELLLDSVGTASATFVKNTSGTGVISTGSNQIGFNLNNAFFITSDNKGCSIFSFNHSSSTYTYTLPSANGTMALTSDITSAISGTTNNLAKFTSTNVIGNSGVSDDGSNLTYLSTAKATLLVKAANNTFYGQLAFTNGTNASYGGISYNNSGQYMQFETNTSEWMRLGSDGKLLIGNTAGSVGALNVTGRIALTTGLFFSSNLTLEDRWEINGGSSTDLVFTRSSVAERMRITSGGNVLIGTSTDNGTKLQVNGQATINGIGVNKTLNSGWGTYSAIEMSPYTSIFAGDDGFRAYSAFGFGVYSGAGYSPKYILSSSYASLYRQRDGNHEFFTAPPGTINNAITFTQPFLIRNDGWLISTTTYNNTSGVSANVGIDSAGNIFRATSSIKYKKDIKAYDKGLDTILLMNPIYYKSISDFDRNKQFAGFIAEEIHELGLNEFVQYNDENNEPEGLNYGNITAILVKAIQELNEKLVRNNIN